MERIRISFYTFLLSFFVGLNLLDCKNAVASHAMGADLTYECLGNNQYRLTYSLYRDCSGINAPANISINISSSCYPVPFTIFLTPTPGSPNEISPTCPTAPNTCHGGTHTGIQEWIYSGIINLPGPCADWIISHSESARNAAITTIDNPGANNLYVYSLLNNTDCSKNGSASAFVSGGVAPFSYQWSNGSSSSLISGLSAGLHSLVVTDANNCVSSSSVAINSQGGIVIFKVNSDSIVCPGKSTGSIDIQVSGGVPPYSFLWSNSFITEDISQLEPGLYSVAVQDSELCISTATFVIHESPKVNALAFTNNPVCAGDEIKLYGYANADSSFHWIGPNGFSSLLQNPSFTSSISDSGVYNLIVFDTLGCSDTTSVHVTVNSCSCVSPVLASSHSDVTCNGGSDGSIDIAATGGEAPYSYSWTGGQTSRNISGLIAGSYTVTVTDARGCFSQLSIAVGQPAVLAVTSLSLVNNICANASQGSISVSGSGGVAPYEYHWSNGVHSSLNSSLTDGNYDVIITDENGCDVQGNFTISSPLGMNLSFATVNDNCGAGIGSASANIIGGTAPYTYLWSNSVSTNSITGLVGGVYDLNVTDANGCTVSGYADISSPGGPTITLGLVMGAGCFGQNNGALDIQVNGGTAPYQYLWSNGSTTQDIVNLVAGIYHVAVSGSDGCVTSRSFSVQEFPKVNAKVLTDDSICASKPLQLFGSGGVSYQWNGPNAFNSILQNPTFNSVLSSSGNYLLTVTDLNGCTGSTSANIFVENCNCDSPFVAEVHQNNLCKGGSEASIALAATGGLPPYNYLWSNGQTTNNMSGLSAGIYQVTVTDASFCTSQLSVILMDPTKVTIGAPVIVDNTCPSDTAGSISVPVAGGTSPYYYQWNNGASTASISQLDTGTYSLIVSDSFGCQDTGIFFVTTPTPMSVQITTTDVSCCVPEQCNNSPVFSNKPVPFACVGQRFCFNHGAYDPDGDSLAYQLITPLTAAGVPVLYDTGYSNTQPVLSSPPVIFNPLTGDICMMPIQAEVSVFAVLVSEYRNGILIGQVERDIQITVLNCNNFIPDVTGINLTPNYTANICAETPFCFRIKSVDGDSPADSTFLTWDSGINGASFITDGAQYESAEFCWTPQLSDVSTTPHCFTVAVSDNHCPYIGTQVHSYCLTVRQVCTDAGPDLSIACGDSVLINGIAGCGLGNYTYNWRLDTTGFSNSQSIYAECGTYILTANDSSVIPGIPITYQRCENSDTLIVTCLGAPVPDFSVTAACSSSPAQFTDLSSGGIINSWEWEFGDGNSSALQNPTHNYLNGGDYQVTLKTCAGTCCSTITHTVHVDSIPQIDFDVENGCDGSAILFSGVTIIGNVNNWQWNFGDQMSPNNNSQLQNPNHIYSDTGSFVVQLIASVSAGCVDTLEKNISIFPNPKLEIPDTNICEGTAVLLIAPGGLISYLWNTGDTIQNIIVNPVATTIYTLSVTDTNLCTAIDTIVVSVLPVIIPGAGNDRTICAGDNTILDGSGGGPMAIYTWNPGGTGKSITVSPLVTTVYTLTISSPGFCEVSTQVTVFVNQTPTLILVDELNICKGDSAFISATSSANNYLWSPGGYTTNAISLYLGSNTTMTLTVSDADGCKTSDSVNVNVHLLPKAGFSSSASECAGTPIQFTDLSTSPVDPIQIRHWEFGNIIDSTNHNPLINFLQYGNYIVKLFVETTEGCSDSIEKSVDIWANPEADFLFTEACEGSPAQFNNLSTIDDGTMLSFQWKFDNANGSVIAAPSFTYSSYGNYPVSLQAVSVHGCIDSIQKPVKIHAFPIASFSTADNCEGVMVPFLDHSTVDSDFISNWTWDFGDGTISSDQNPHHSYHLPGNYSVVLNVKSDFGCPDSTIHFIHIAPAPSPAFQVADICFGAETQIVNISDTSVLSIISSTWDWGDGNISNGWSPSHIYENSGLYNITLSVLAVNGCSATFQQLGGMTVFENHPANFFVDLSVASDISPMVTFRNLTDSVSSSFWTFGDGNYSTEFSPSHLYSGTGKYEIQLITIDINGCYDTTLSTVEISPSSAVYVPNTFTPNTDLKNDLFRVYTYNIIQLDVQIFDRWGLLIYQWDNPNGGWNGKLNGRPVQDDVYVYRISTTDINNIHKVQYGKVSVIY